MVTARFAVPDALDVPTSAAPSSWEVNIEQMIWGHRLLNDQTPWLVLLEALAIMAARKKDKNTEAMFPTLGATHESFKYDVAKRVDLRTLLFQDNELDRIARSGDELSDGAMWDTWRGKRDEADIQHLRDGFTTFAAFHNAVDLLRAAVVEPDRDRRSTSRHLIPGGADMLMADYGAKKGKINNDRKFFARGGELVFLMLSRSKSAAELAPLIERRILRSDGRWNRVAKLLQTPSAPDDDITYNVGYLPLREHKVYDRLAEDWLAILKLEGLPDDQVAEPLMRLTGLHVVRYIIERAAHVLGRSVDQPIPVDMATATAGGLRRTSRERFQLHREMTRLAIRKVIDDFAASDDWKAACAGVDPFNRRKTLILEVFQHKVTAPMNTADQMIEDLRATALEKHENHLGQMIAQQATQIGLSVSRVGQGRWYAANNGFIEAVVLANVHAPMELERFLDCLWDRYRLVIGSRIGQNVLGADAPFEQLKANQRVFEERLRMLGFLERLSDDCAFVSNPYGSSKAN